MEDPWRVVPAVVEEFGRVGAHLMALLHEFGHGVVVENRTRLCTGLMAMHPEAASAHLKRLWLQRCVWAVRRAMHENVLRCWKMVNARRDIGIYS